MNYEYRLKFCYCVASNGERVGDLSGVFDFVNIDDCVCELFLFVLMCVCFGVVCVFLKFYKCFGVSLFVCGVEIVVLFGVGEKNDTSDAYKVFVMGVIVVCVGVGGGL